LQATDQFRRISGSQPAAPKASCMPMKASNSSTMMEKSIRT
jgi:hypothetical protein